MLALLALALATDEPVRLTFADAVRLADYVVRAEIVGRREPPPGVLRDDEDGAEGPFPFHELRVERVLKGPAIEGGSLLVPGNRPWSVATGVEPDLGQRGVYLLCAPAASKRERASWARAGTLAFSGVTVATLIGEGQGTFVEREHGGRVLLDPGWTELPRDLVAARDGWRELADPAALEARVLETIEKQRRPLLTAELLTGPPGGRWTVALARDRTATLDLHDAARGRVELRLGSLASLDHALRAAPPPEGTFLLPSDLDATVRLVLHARDGDRELLLHFRRGAAEPSDAAGRCTVDLWSALAGQLALAWPADAPGPRTPRVTNSSGSR